MAGGGWRMNAIKLVNKKNLSREDWLKWRQKGIGGSDAAAVAGLNRWRSPLSVWLDKTGQTEPIEENERMYWGTQLEEVVAREFTKRTGKKVRNVNYILGHADYDFMLVNVDRLVVGEKAGLECKTTSVYSADKWTEDEVPPEGFLQCQHSMAVTDFVRWYLAVLIGGQEYRCFVVDRDDEAIKHLIKIESEFWDKVVNMEMPSPDGSKDADDVLDNLYTFVKQEEIYLPPENKGWVQQYLEAHENMKDAEKRKKEAQQQLKQSLGEFHKGFVDNFEVGWVNSVSRRLDSKTLKDQYPKIYDKFVVESQQRRFSIKKLKKESKNE